MGIGAGGEKERKREKLWPFWGISKD